MQENNEVQQGWDFATNIMGADIAANMGEDYVGLVEKAIEQLEKNINNHDYRNLGIKQLQGYMLEEWSAGTFNVDAVAADSSYRAQVLHSTAKDSVDILMKNGDVDVGAYSAKSYANGAKSAIEQARFNPDTNTASYHGQGRLVPEDQLNVAKDEAHRQFLRNKNIRPDVADAYHETEQRLTDTISTDDGTKSREISRSELERIAKESKQQDFKASEHGVSLENSIQVEYLLKEALKAGYTAAAVTIAFQLAPEIIKAIDYLIKNGELDIKQVKRMGTKAISAGAEGFIRGSVASLLKILCETGALGEEFKGIDPTRLGTVVVLVVQTVKNSILVAAGKKSARQMGNEFVDGVIISVGYLVGNSIGDAIGTIVAKTIAKHVSAAVFQSMTPFLPVIGYLIGTLVGTAFCVIYNIGKKKLISFCVETGFTCFGLVEQDYELPEEVITELGIDVIPIPRTEVEKIDVPRTDVFETDVERTEYETIDITVLRRGVIAVNKVGYVFD